MQKNLSKLDAKVAEVDACLHERMSEVVRSSAQPDDRDHDLDKLQIEVSDWKARLRHGKSDEKSLLEEGDEILRQLRTARR